MPQSEKLQIISSFEVYKNEQDLANEDRLLLMHAKRSLESAYAPYSHFNVGAAILLENGEIITGNNQENAAYPSGLCAERVAIFYAGAKYPGVKIKSIAVSCKAENQVINDPVSPCGACRQAIAEYETRYAQKIRMIMAGESGRVFIAESIESLLPLMFNRKYLK
ncbi:MAG: cytidine deaminase [Bacteroidetes bacterium]|jgi:cytidine deaminase|nr:cytidine deaminase [Bacteroidota bacterium]